MLIQQFIDRSLSPMYPHVTKVPPQQVDRYLWQDSLQASDIHPEELET